MFSITDYESQIEKKIKEIAAATDPAHDLLHFKRVVSSAKKLAAEEKAKLEVVIPAAWLHDFVIVPKNDPRRKIASRLSAEAAVIFLKEIAYPVEYLSEIGHAIEAHSFSANIEPKTLEAKIVQDADRLDGLGAIGIARCFATAGLLKRAFYSEDDSFCATRAPNDALFTVDHFYQKLFKTAESLQTQAAKNEGKKRVESMRDFLKKLECEISFAGAT